MTCRIWTMVLAISLAAMFCCTPRCCASSFHPVDTTYLAKIETKTRQLLNAVEHLQQEIVEELSGVKEKQLFQKVDQVLLDLTKMEKLLSNTASVREDLYKQFDSLDGKVANLRKAVPELATKHPILLRGAEGIRILTDDLYFAVSEGDASPERFRQVLARQARVMSDVIKKLSRAAQYAVGDTSGRGELLADMQKLAEICATFETVVAIRKDLEEYRKGFLTLNDAWARVVQGMSLLPQTENVYLLRTALRADSIHERLFRALEIKGKRPVLTIRI